MPSWHSPTYRKNVGPRLHAYRVRNSIPQGEIADELRISQTYLSRLERGQRVPSAEVAERAARLLADIDDEDRVGSDQPAIDSELEQTYDQALIAMGAGDDVTAEILLDQILRTEPQRAMPNDFYARVRVHLGSVRRDHNELDGPAGALALYNDAVDVLFKRERLATAREVTFLQGACMEMKGSYGRARVKYEYAQRLGVHTSSAQAIIRAENRLGALATKAGHLDVARRLLTSARSGALYLETPGTYGFVTEKLAILEVRAGNPDRAVDLVTKSMLSLLPTEHLRRVQGDLVMADALLAAGETGDAVRFLEDAQALAKSHRFDHQVVMLTKLFKRLP